MGAQVYPEEDTQQFILESSVVWVRKVCHVLLEYIQSKLVDFPTSQEQCELIN